MISGKRSILAISFFLNFCFFLSAQTIQRTEKQTEYSFPFIFSAGYKMPVNKNKIIDSGHGVYVELGINPGYYFSKKLFAGVYLGYAGKDNLWSTSFSKRFVADYTNSFTDHTFSGLDSEVVNSTKKLFAEEKGRSLIIPGCETKSFHSSDFYAGFIFRMPFKKLGPELKLYGGIVKTSFQGGHIITQADFNYYTIRAKMYGIELILSQFKTTPVKTDLSKNPATMKIGALSFYYECSNLKSGSLYFTDGDKSTSIPFKRFMSENFLQKYKNEISYGIKLAISIN
jgi:hypothetical protein